MKKIFCILLFYLYLLPGVKLHSALYDSIFIIINDDVVTFNEFKLNYLKLKKDLLRRGLPLPKESKLLVFNQLVNEKIIKQIADKKEIFVSNTEVEESINRVKKMNRMSDAAFKQALKQEGKSMKDMEEEYRKQILTEKIMSIELRPRIGQPTEEEMKDYYKKNKRKMVTPSKIKISHILIKDNPNASLSERSKIKNKAKQILQKVLQSKNFEKMVKKYSEDEASIHIGGNIGYIAKGEWLPEIDKVVFKLKTGEIAGTILQSRWGYHIVKVTGKKKKKSVPYKDMRSRIQNFLINQKMQKEFEKWMDEQKQNSYFEVIFPEDDKYIYDYDKWQKKNSKKVISRKKFKKKIASIKI